MAFSFEAVLNQQAQQRAELQAQSKQAEFELHASQSNWRAHCVARFFIMRARFDDWSRYQDRRRCSWLIAGSKDDYALAWYGTYPLNPTAYRQCLAITALHMSDRNVRSGHTSFIAFMLEDLLSGLVDREQQLVAQILKDYYDSH